MELLADGGFIEAVLAFFENGEVKGLIQPQGTVCLYTALTAVTIFTPVFFFPSLMSTVFTAFYIQEKNQAEVRGCCHGS